MREHIYRGKRIDNKEWEYGNLIIDGNFAYIILLENIDRYDRHEVDPETVGQFTGSLDKNGARIFEGDILASGEGRVPTLVEWVKEDCGFYIFNLQRNRERNRFDKYFKPFVGEVIGNIHDNPELLEAK